MKSIDCINYFINQKDFLPLNPNDDESYQDFPLEKASSWKRIYKKELHSFKDIGSDLFNGKYYNIEDAIAQEPVIDLHNPTLRQELQFPFTCRVFELKESDYFWVYVFTDITDNKVLLLEQRSD